MKNRYTFQFNFFKIVAAIGFLLGAGTNCIFAQQDAQYTQYMYNTSTINPAYAGSQGALTAVILYRNQWTGLEGAPKVLNFTAHSKVGKKTGAGISLTSDEIGPSKEVSITADFSHTLQMGETSQLAFGLKGGANLLNVDYSLLTILDSGDSEFQQNIDNRLSPIIGAGLYYYDHKFYAGLSVPNVLKSTHYDDTTISNAQERPNLYLISGYVFDLNKSWLFKPAFLLKFLEDAPISADLSANFLYNNILTLGVGYRYNAAVSCLVGFQISKSIHIGYAYDYDTTDLGNFNSGSHEVFLRLSPGNNKDYKLSVPRFF